MNTEDLYWLNSEAAEPWLRRAAEQLTAGPATPAQVRALRASLGEERARLVIEQAELRRKAREKFSRADDLFFTRVGLEQATDERLAAYKATRFAGYESLRDLCCGIGGDAMALAQLGEIMLIDRDEYALLLATANVMRFSPKCEARDEPVGPQHVTGADAWHIDPDRRASGKRTSRVELGEPGVEMIDTLRTIRPEAAVKLAPAADVPQHWLTECEREWIETRGECRQQVAWFGALAEAPERHVATLVTEEGEACSYIGASNVPLHACDKLGRYVYDPSPSLCAAQLVGGLAEALELAALSSTTLYLTSDEEIIHPHLQVFDVEAELPLDIRRIRAYCQAHSIGRLEIKKRGVDITPESLRPQLQLSGDEEATLLLARVGKQTRAMICRRK